MCTISCQKSGSRTTYDETFQVRFKLDGKEYVKVLQQNELNEIGSVISYNEQGKRTITQGPVYQLDSDYGIYFELGYLYHIAGDDAGNFQKLKNLLRVGSKKYECLGCDTSIRDAVELRLIESNTGISWCTTRRDLGTSGLVPVTNEQNGSSFVVTEIKESTVDSRDAVIVKGTFNCNLYNWSTGAKKVLTGGEFTCILSTLHL